MDLMAAIQEFNASPEQIRARQARRAVREEHLYDRLGEALGRPSAVRLDPEAEQTRALIAEIDALSRTAAGWNMPIEQGMKDGQALGNQHPGAAAILIVRRALSEYEIPTEVDLRYHGIKRASGHGAYNVDEGIVFVQATLHSISGPRHHIDIPVIIREGRVLAPSILLHEGSPRILTQHTFDDIIGRGEFTAKMPDRPTMFAPPPDKDAAARPRREVPRVAPGMFKVLPSRTLIRGAITGVHQGQAAETAAEKFLDMGFQDVAIALQEYAEGKFGDLPFDRFVGLLHQDIERGQHQVGEPGEEEIYAEAHRLVDQWAQQQRGQRGHHQAQRYESCPECQGTGEVLESLPHGGGEDYAPCPTCHGTGEVMEMMPEDEGPPGHETAPPWHQEGDSTVLRQTQEPAPGKAHPSDYYSQGYAQQTFPRTRPHEEEELKDRMRDMQRRRRMRPKRSDDMAMRAFYEPDVSAMRGFLPTAAISPSQIAMRFVSWYEHDIKKGEFRDMAEVEESMRDAATQCFMRDAIPSGFQSDAHRERVIAEARAFADEVVSMALPEVEDAFTERQAFYEPDVTGFVENGRPGREVPGADGSHLDVAERPTKDLRAPGQKVRLKQEATCRDRGGVVYMLPKGSSGEVIRDVDGAGRAYYVRFDELGITATVPARALAG